MLISVLDINVQLMISQPCLQSRLYTEKQCVQMAGCHGMAGVTS